MDTRYFRAGDFGKSLIRMRIGLNIWILITGSSFKRGLKCVATDHIMRLNIIEKLTHRLWFQKHYLLNRVNSRIA